MVEAIYDWQLWVVVALLMIAIYVIVRVERHKGFHDGVIKGFLSGVGFTIQVVANEKLINSVQDKNIPLTEDEIIRMLGPKLTKELLKCEKPKV